MFPEFGVPSHVDCTRPWASPGQPENSRSDLVKSHLAGRRRGSLESRRSRSEGPCPTVKASSPRSGSHPRWRCWRRCWLPPIRTSGFVTVSSRPDCLRRNFALPPGQPTTRLSAAMATDAVLEVNALPSENEEQDRADALDEPRVSFLIPCSFRKVPDRQLIAPRSILSLYPLRC